MMTKTSSLCVRILRHPPFLLSLGYFLREHLSSLDHQARPAHGFDGKVICVYILEVSKQYNLSAMHCYICIGNFNRYISRTKLLVNISRP